MAGCRATRVAGFRQCDTAGYCRKYSARRRSNHPAEGHPHGYNGPPSAVLFAGFPSTAVKPEVQVEMVDGAETRPG
jgi:hypothetical protein